MLLNARKLLLVLKCSYLMTMDQEKHFLKVLLYASLLSLLILSCSCEADHGKESRGHIHFAFHEEAPNIIMPVVFQDSIKYLNPQWTELTQDIVSMFIGDMTSEDVLNAIDERRATQAEAVGDENWQ